MRERDKKKGKNQINHAVSEKQSYEGNGLAWLIEGRGMGEPRGF